MRLSISKPGRISLILLWLLSLAIAACGSHGGTGETGGASVRALTTIYPVTYFTERIGGERVDVRPLVKPGIDAHDFEPRPSDIRALREASVVIYANESFEIWIGDALDATNADDRVIVEAAALGGTIPSESGSSDGHDHDSGIDPHVWLNPLEAAQIAARIRDGLIAADPDGAPVYTANAKSLISALTDLDGTIAAALTGCALDAVVVSHAAYSHLLEPLGIRQIALTGLAAEAESGAQHISEIIEEIRSLGIRNILQEPLADDALARTISAETGAEIVPLHPLESLTAEEREAGDDYFSIMERNTGSLSLALGCVPAAR